MALMHSGLQLGPLRGPKPGRSCPPILAIICKANNIDTDLPVDGSIIAPSDTVDDDDDDDDQSMASNNSKEQKTEPTQTDNSGPSTLSASASSITSDPSSQTLSQTSAMSSSGSGSISRSTETYSITTHASSHTSVQSSSQVSSSTISATSAATATPYIIVGQPGANDQAITDFLKQILDSDQYSHILYIEDETGTTGSTWFFGDLINATYAFSFVTDLNQTQLDGIQSFSGVNYLFPDTIVEELVGIEPGSSPTISPYSSTNGKRSDLSIYDRSFPLEKRDPQVAYTRQIDARDELKILSNYFTSDVPEEPDLSNEDYVYETPAGSGTWVYLVSEFYDPDHPVGCHFSI